jgi:hypothetical protein
MFGELVRCAGTPAYRPAWSLRMLGRLVRSVFVGPSAFLAILAAEELLDAVNRRTMRDRSLHAVSREVAKIHVIEEARHVSFARKYLEQELPKLGAFRRALLRLAAPLTVSVVAGAMVNPGVYQALAIPGGVAGARENPHHRARIVADLADLVAFLEKTGVITERTRPYWVELGLAAPRPTARRPTPGVLGPALPLVRGTAP